ncbi:hypothetical protein OSTOST_24605, partial [Ostertagia ostertagi]
MEKSSTHVRWLCICGSKRAHVSNMTRAMATIIRHGSLQEDGRRCRKESLSSFDVEPVHNRILIVVPMVLRRMAWMSGGCRTRQSKQSWMASFTIDFRAVVLILPAEELRKVTVWVTIMSYLDLWTTC